MIERIEIIRNSDGSTDAQGIAGTINIVLKTNPAKRALDVSSGVGYNQTNGVVYNTGVGYSGKVKKIQYTLKGNYQTRINGKDKDKSEVSTIQNNLFEKQNQSTRYEEIAFSPQVHCFLEKKNRFVISPLFLYSDGDRVMSKNKTKYINDTDVATGREYETQRIARRTGSFRVDHINQVDKRLLLNNGITISQTFRNIDRSEVTLFEDPIFNDTVQTIDGVKDRELFLRLGGTYMLSKSWHLQGVIEGNSKYRKINREQYVKGFQYNSNIEDLYTQKEGRTNVYLINRFSIFRSNLNIGLRYESMRQSNAIQTTYITNFTKRLTTIEKESKNDQLHPIFQYSFTIHPDKVLKGIIRKNYKEEKNIQGEDSLKLKKDKLFQYSDIVIKPNISRNVRRPSFTDMNSYVEYFDGTLSNPDKGGNPYLKPEVAYGLDLAVEYYPRGKKGVIGVNYYSRWISNMIVKYVEFDVNSERFIQRPSNVGNGVAWGLELDGRYEFNIRKSAILLLRSNITIPRSKIVNPVSGEKAPIKNQPRFFYNIGSDVTIKKWKNFMMGINYNHYPGFYREIFTSAVISQKIYQMPLRKIDCYTGIQLSKYFSCRVSAQNFIRSQKYKEDIKYDVAGIQNIRKFEREIYRPTYLFTLIYKL
jgi:iron complex outermembrane receptor protein